MYAKESINKEEANEKQKLRKDFEERLAKFKLELDKELKLKEEQNRYVNILLF